MANEIRITVCVVALTQSDYADLDPSIQAKLAALKPSFDFAISGKPYATSPDEWQPFNVALPIREYLRNANLTATFLSSQLYDNTTALDVLKKTQLYIIDPLVLTHSKKRDWLARDVQRTIYTADVEKAFCIILPADMPPSLRAEIATMYATDLNNLYGISGDTSLYEWEVESADRLRRYLNSLARQLTSKADLGALLQVKALLDQLGTRDPGLLTSPQLIPAR